jgi:dipeptidyl aminopeptidase/acylaminoacyl peptidase
VFGVIGTGVENLQLLATRGFAVLAPDIPPIDTRDEMHELASVILPAVDRIVALGIADSARVGVMGHSWGGYATLALLVQTQRFRAAIVRGGHGDNVATYGALQTSGYAFGIVNQEKTLGGTLWEQRDRYLANSPIYFFDRIHTPVLLIHGESETTVPIFLANQVFASLQRLGKEVEFVRYGGEDHSEEGWSYANQRDYLRRMIGWFEARLTGKRR